MMHKFKYETIPGDLGKLIELRDNSEYPELKNLWWPRYDQECWNYMHKHRITPEFFDELMTHVTGRGVMVQAGGNCGQYVRQFSQRFGTVYTFEPDPLNFLCLTLNCGSNVIKTQACLGNDKNFVGIDRTHDAGAIYVDGPGNVPTVRIDDMNLPSCDLIQLDIEGYEYFALLGAQRTIEKYHPVIMIEWYEPWAERYSTNKTMLDNFFSKLGYCHITEQDNDHIYKYTP
jgi:FkbM family methyltransferase